MVCDDSGQCYRTRGGQRVIIQEYRDSYNSYEPRERYYRTPRPIAAYNDGPSVGIRAPGVSVGVGVGGDRW